jgi:hypothetical protein
MVVKTLQARNRPAYAVCQEGTSISVDTENNCSHTTVLKRRKNTPSLSSRSGLYNGYTDEEITAI